MPYSAPDYPGKYATSQAQFHRNPALALVLGGIFAVLTVVCIVLMVGAALAHSVVWSFALFIATVFCGGIVYTVILGGVQHGLATRRKRHRHSH